ncbi:putative aquaporin NIP-type [Heracleum sosnowskyi]|uniref:Aquaporin NIP-type n=1 Tax=Heracleum sosnowskyi TaxID=360622 RepID=A0AAD8H5E1_9APIA|nr:putative aquaporin NIP-type [Heracleum sosnowskyi]KAK1359952.1 putative aquaporin NIP-type [Heracleum sosnowskyi]
MTRSELVNDDNEVSKLEMGIKPSESNEGGWSLFPTPYTVTLQKIIAEVVGTYFVIFAGCGSVVVNKLYGGTITFPGICVTWGLIVMVMIYCLGHVSGAHFNPAVTFTQAVFKRFSWKLVPWYIVSQVLGSLLASVTLKLLFDVNHNSYFGTLPVGSDVQSLFTEFFISSILMFVICGVATDDRALGNFAGLAVGMTIMLNVFVAGPVSGASMNPARSLGPAIVMHEFRGIWVYFVGPTAGIMTGSLIYQLLRNKPFSR